MGYLKGGCCCYSARVGSRIHPCYLLNDQCVFLVSCKCLRLRSMFDPRVCSHRIIVSHYALGAIDPNYRIVLYNVTHMEQSYVMISIYPYLFGNKRYIDYTYRYIIALVKVGITFNAALYYVSIYTKKVQCLYYINVINFFVFSLFKNKEYIFIMNKYTYFEVKTLRLYLHWRKSPTFLVGLSL